MNNVSIEDKLKDEILSIMGYCTNCKACFLSCPRFEITSGEVTQGASGIARSLYYAVKWNEDSKDVLNELRNIIYTCTTCGSCQVTCKSVSTGTRVLDAIEKGRELLIEKQIGPMPMQKKVLDSLHKHGNPHMVTARKRKEAVSGLKLQNYSAQSEYLLFLGCSTTTDPDMHNTALALTKILERANISYGILEDEICCGEPSLKMGETGLFEELSGKNLDAFKKNGVKKIVTFSPHCFDILIKRYPSEQMQGIQVQHYTQLLSDLVENGKLIFPTGIKKRVVYHDPCYLSKQNNVCAQPRNVLKSITGIDLVEFNANGVNSLCCGGGGGRMWADFDNEVNRLANIRVQEATEKQADVLVTACPWCFTNMRDGAKVMKVENKLEVLSLLELCAQAL